MLFSFFKSELGRIGDRSILQYTLHRCSNLTRVDATNTLITPEGLNKFASSSKHKLKCYGTVVDKKPETKRKRK